MPRPTERKKVTVLCLAQRKSRGEKIVAVTAYDHPTARIVDEAGVDLILVGDSLGMVVQGNPTTLTVTLDQMIYHTAMVARARPRALVVADMPFGTYHVSPAQGVESAIRLVREGGAEAVKLEGGRKRLPVIEAILAAEIPVIAHLGLTPQSVHALGGFRVQGRLKEKARELGEDAVLLERAGVSAIVLESIPAEVAAHITARLTVPTIGIGAGKGCDGQILVFHDLLGLGGETTPRFVRRYADLAETAHTALRRYGEEVDRGEFPGEGETTHLEGDVEDFFS